MSNNHSQSRDAKIEAFRQACRTHGIKVTPQRIEIWLQVADSKIHPTAEDVFEAVRKKLPTISLDTVYRTLNTLAECGLIAKVYIIHDRTRFDPNVTHHHHLVCVECKGIADFQWPEFDDARLPQTVERWGQPDSKHIQVIGICAQCLAKRGKTANAPILR
ncbi:MAG: Fur family transcriptional regulator [Desulfomonilaceae bacterium]